MKSFANVNPNDIAEALRFLRNGADRGQTITLAGGGSDLVGMIKDQLVAPDVLVNLKGLQGLREIESNGDGMRLGGLVTLNELAQHTRIRSRYAVLAEAAESVATPQIRNVGTLAGNICQRPWCWYFRQGFPCFKNGGSVCFSWVGENQFNAIFGGGPSFIVHPSDTAPALVALNARIRIAGPEGERSVPASEFFILPEKDASRENVLEGEEMVTEIELPPAAPSLKSTYAKVMDREAWTHAIVSVAIALEVEDRICRRAAVVLGGVAPIPWRLPDVEALLAGRALTPELAAQAGKQAVARAQPLSKNEYKVPLTESLVRRTLLKLTA